MDEKQKIDLELAMTALSQQTKKLLDGHKPTVSSILPTVVNLMQAAESINTIHGTQKKQMIVDALGNYISDEIKDDLPESDFRDLMMYVNFVLPELIDTLISIDKKEIIIKASKIVKSCFPCCSSSSTK
jgi:hypothetical protein